MSKIAKIQNEDEMQPKKFNIGEYNKSLTPEQRKAQIQKASTTRKKNTLENKIIAKSMSKAMKSSWKIKDQEGNDIVVSGAEAIAYAMLKDATNPDNVKHRAAIFNAIRDTVDGKPKTEQEVQHTGTITWEMAMKRIKGDDSDVSPEILDYEE